MLTLFLLTKEAELLYGGSPELACDKICEANAIAVVKLGAET